MPWDHSPTSSWAARPRGAPASPTGRAARRRSGRGRRSPKPDAVLLFEDLLVFIEAKLGARNATTPSDPDNPKRYETGHGSWFGRVFREGVGFRSLAVEARLYELMRLWLIGTWVAEDTGRRFALVNLVRSSQEVDIEARFGSHIVTGPDRQFRRLTWEGLVHALQPAGGWPRPAPDLRGYLGSNTLGYAVQWDPLREFGVLRRALGGPDVNGLGEMT